MGGMIMYLGSLEERRARSNEIKLVTATLYEAKVKDEEITASVDEGM